MAMIQGLLLKWFRKRRWRRYWTDADAGRVPLRLALWLVAIVALHTAAMALFEGMSVFEGAWLTATTIMTVGYGDLAAKTVEGRLATMALMYVGAIFVLAKAINDWLDFKSERAERKLHGLWNWNMTDHLLIIGTPNHRSLEQSIEFFERLLGQVRKAEAWAATPAELLTPVFGDQGLPLSLRDLGVVHRTGRPADRAALAAVRPEAARAVVVLADTEADAISDAITFDAIDRIRKAGCSCPVIAECVDDGNRERLRACGASAVVRPLRGYPEMLARAIVAPGAEEIITDLFTAEGNECRRIDLSPPWCGAWVELCLRILQAGIGTPLAYADAEGGVHTNPVGAAAVEAAALFVLIDDDLGAPADKIAAALAGAVERVAGPPQ
ncbi:MAG: hypothetical protein GC191_20600 [Azospirillum sp.]|nr:hypothetical protein [Azospirillum sp.]